MTRFTLTFAPVAATGLAVLLVAACAGCSGEQRGSGPSASPVGPTATAVVSVPVLQPTEPVDRAEFYGLGIGEERTDQYGAYRPLTTVDTWAIADLDEAAVPPEVLEKVGNDELMIQAHTAFDFLVTSVIDSPLVFDDSAEAQEEFWSVADGALLQVEPFRDFFESRADQGSFALVDDDRSEWRQAAGYEPAPYTDDRSRVRICSVSLINVGYKTGDNPGPSFRFRAVYARPVVKTTGELAWERVSTSYTISIGYTLDGRPGISGLNFNGDTEVGMYVEGGWEGLPEVERGSAWTGTVVEDGRGVSFPVFDGWSTTSDMAEAGERGIRMDDPDFPHAEPAYYRGVGENADDAPYLVTRVDPPNDDPYVSEIESAIEAADLPLEYFWSDRAQGGRVRMAGAQYAIVELRPASQGDKFDIIVVDVLDERGMDHQAEYYVDAGDGAARLVDVVDGLKSDVKLLRSRGTPESDRTESGRAR